MAKRYNINDIDGTTFTYQLYANMNPQVSGETGVTSSAIVLPEDLFASFVLTGAVLPSSSTCAAQLTFKNGGTTLAIYSGNGISGPIPPNGFNYTFANGPSTSVLQEFVDVNGSYVIINTPTQYEVYKDDTLRGVVTKSSALAATSVEIFYQSLGGGNSGTFSDIILGS